MDELEIVQRVELRFLLANDDEKLKAAIDTFLVPLLQKLKSSRSDVVRKVVEVLHFIKKKKKQTPDLPLPLGKLVELYKSSVLDFDPSTVRQNSQVLPFIGLALTTSSLTLLADLALGLRADSDPASSEAIKRNAAEQFSLFLVALNGIVDKVPKEELSVSHWDSGDVAVLANRMAQFFFLDLRQYSPNSLPNLSAPDAAFFIEHGAKVGVSYPQENERTYSQTKKSILVLASSNVEPFKNVLVAATGDKLLDISRKAHAEVVKLDGFNSGLLQQWALKGSDALRTEVIEILLRRRLLTGLNPEIIRGAFERGDLNLRQAALRLLREASAAGQRWDSGIATKFGVMVQQYIVDDGWPRSHDHSAKQVQLRQQCYELLGLLAPSQDTLDFLFQSLERDSPENAPSIQKALSKVLESSDITADPKKLLNSMLYSANNRSRYTAVRFAAMKLPPSDPIQRVIFLLGLDPKENRSDVVIEAKRGLQSRAEDLPSFAQILDAARLSLGTRLKSTETVNGSLLFLLACMLRWPTESIEWSDDLETAITYTEAGSARIREAMIAQPDEAKAFLSLAFSFLFSDTYYDSVVLVCRSLIFAMSQSDREMFAEHIIDLDSLSALVSNDKIVYGSLLAELIPLLAPNRHIEGNGKTQLLAQAYRTAIWGTNAASTVETALSTRNVEAIQLLAISNNLSVDDTVIEAASGSQLALACLSTCASETQQQEILSKLFDRDFNAFDELVANGEAISVATSGWASKVLHEKYPYLRAKYESAALSGREYALQQQALSKVVSGIKGSPKTRRTAAVRLLCLTQYSFYNINERPGIASGIQTCFMNLLTDSDDVTQESAGRGLGILFENGGNDKALQRSLLSTLVTSFTDDDAAKKLNTGTLTADTQVFEPGVLPSAPQSDSSISTYKDVLSLANESGDSSLVYKFMSLSASSQIWSGRKGIAFSLERILAKSELGKQIASGSELGNKLVSKLYRYLYDPIEVTREAMKHIWSALVPNSERSRIMKLYLTQICKDLTDGCINREWRVRQASASAFSDLLSQGYINYSVELWQLGFRLVDDIKDSVRTAGKEFVKSLTQSLIRTSAKANSSVDLSHIIPFLLKGLHSDSTRKYSLETLLKLSETNGFQPWAAQVLEELCLQLSSLEPQALNYFALNTSQSLIDDARVKQLRESPIMQSLEAMVERGVPSLDEMWELLPRLVKNSVGVPSKLAASRLLVLCCLRSFGREKHASESLLNATYAELWGVNEMVGENYAATIGYLCRQLPLQLVVKYVEQLQVKFASSESEDERTRRTVGAALKGLSNNAVDVFSAVSSAVLPLAFFGQYSVSDPKHNDFKDVWEGNTGGSASLRLYRSNILAFGLEMLKNSSSRLMQIAAAKALTLALDQPTATPADDSIVAKALLKSLAGRSWPGKEYLFEALVSASASIEKDLVKPVKERVLNELQRRNEEYKLAILPSAAKFLRQNRDDELSKDIEAQLAEGLISVLDGDSDDQVKAFKEVLVSLKNPELTAKVEEKSLVDLDSWKLRQEACLALREKSFDARSFKLLTEKCANDQQHEIVRLQWARTANVFKNEELVRQALQQQVATEFSTVVLAEIKASLA